MWFAAYTEHFRTLAYISNTTKRLYKKKYIGYNIYNNLVQYHVQFIRIYKTVNRTTGKCIVLSRSPIVQCKTIQIISYIYNQTSLYGIGLSNCNTKQYKRPLTLTKIEPIWIDLKSVLVRFEKVFTFVSSRSQFSFERVHIPAYIDLTH